MRDRTDSCRRLRRGLLQALAAGPLVMGFASLTSFGAAAVRAATEQNGDAAVKK